MSVADRLGLQDLEGALMGEARAAWHRWVGDRLVDGVVDDLVELPAWALGSPNEANPVLGVLASLTASEPAAVTALVWVLLPGAEKVARRLADLHGDIDGMVAGQLWIEASRSHELATERVAAAILRRTRSQVMADLGVGDAAKRRDRAWTHVVCGDGALAALAAPEVEPPADYTVLELLRAALLDGAVVGFDLCLVLELAMTAARLGAPAHRGRMGLTSPAVVEEVAAERHLNARSVRRRAGEVLDRLREYASVRDDADALARWRVRHPPVVLSAREQMELAIEEEEAWWLMTGPEHLAPAEAWARVARQVIPRHARRA